MVETTTTKNMKWRREKYKENWITLNMSEFNIQLFPVYKDTKNTQ